MSWAFSTARNCIFGWGTRAKLPPLLHGLGKRVFLLSDPNLAATDWFEPLITQIRAANLEVFVSLEGQAEPSVAQAEKVFRAAASFSPNVLVAIGGGSNMDLGKVTAILLQHGGKPSAYFGSFKVPGPVLPLVCLPTTAGTGSEVSHSAVLTDTEAGVKVSTLSPFLRPACALVDPELTLSCPPKVTAESGMDALTHAIEAYTATRAEDLQAEPDFP
jgi:alcohol dehydrogenase class IV